jgi:hypothetical protein
MKHMKPATSRTLKGDIYLVFSALLLIDISVLCGFNVVGYGPISSGGSAAKYYLPITSANAIIILLNAICP